MSGTPKTFIVKVESDYLTDTALFDLLLEAGIAVDTVDIVPEPNWDKYR